ncbi:MAG: hypothetical protein L0177_06930 [Chloroflexi bacterium]|nr:hypothetical protein [Chloroflexota bacterium]
MYLWKTDRTGFPLLQIKGVGSIHLWPVTKLQIEAFMRDASRFGDAWYEETIKGNPRVSHLSLDSSNYEGLFATAVTPDEAMEFAGWLGDGFDIPTAEDWREARRQFEAANLRHFQAPELRGAAAVIWDRMRSFHDSALRLSMMDRGLMELVRSGGEYRELGSPRPSFHRHVRDPMKDAPVGFTSANSRIRYLGFRLIKRQ